MTLVISRERDNSICHDWHVCTAWGQRRSFQGAWKVIAIRRLVLHVQLWMSELHPPHPPLSVCEPFTCNSCWWICCSWKRRLAHQTPLPTRSKSVSLPRSKPVCDTPGGDSCEAANKRRRRGGKKPLLGIIAGNSFNGSRWKTALNAGGNFANYCSMHLSNLILRLPPCIFVALCCFSPLILHSWVVQWDTLTCYIPSLEKKK